MRDASGTLTAPLKSAAVPLLADTEREVSTRALNDAHGHAMADVIAHVCLRSARADHRARCFDP